MDLLNRFSIKDFLAYLFPGSVSLFGIYLLLWLTPLKDEMSLEQHSLFAILFLLIISYSIGIILAGPSTQIYKWYKRFLLGKDYLHARETIPVPGFEEEIKAAFINIFNSKGDKEFKWTSSHFYICRSLITEYMPNAAYSAQRQSGIHQLRRNLFTPLIIWLINGIIWGITFTIGEKYIWGITLISIALILFIVLANYIILRLNKNEEREVREILTAFVAGYKKGIFAS